MTVQHVRIGTIATLTREAESLRADEQYRTLGVLNHGRGLFERPVIRGSETKYPRLFRVRTGQLLYSKLFAWEGSVAIVPDEFDSYFVSPEFPSFDVDRAAVDVVYLGHAIRWSGFEEQLRDATTGMGQRRQRVNVAQFEGLVIPLPELPEQRRIADRLDHVEDVIRTTQSARLRSKPSVEALLCGRADGPVAPMSDLVAQVRRPVAVSAGRTFSMLGMRWYGGGLFTRETVEGSGLAASTVYEVAAGDLVYNRLFAWKRSFGIVSAGHSGSTVSNEFPTFEIDQDRVLPRFLLAQVLGEAFTEEVNSVSSGSTPTSRNRLKEVQFLSLTVKVPSLERQAGVVRHLAALDRFQILRDHSNVVSAALLPAARNEVFSSLV